ncbi:MAG: succinate dehydrogenase cytochrome b subunit [Gemmatimonadales bacterium]|nr:succinate dehydrogenase cytochrome b subunit [Gemmatimonadales bacterium]MDZ4391075.1 succinate dehydrogenase cytochrome b subunit [Gemmatimonadales bacterium]
MNRLLALWHSTVGKKVAMALSGILLVGFLISHMASNVLVFVDPAKLDAYAEWLRGFGALLWVARAGLLALVLIHIAAAWQLTQRAREARPRNYARAERQVSTYAARTMRWGGVLILVFIVYHILHYTTGTLHPDFVPGEVGRNLVVGMQVPWTAVFYAVTMVAIGAHFYHGIWSVFQTLGFNHPAWNQSRISIALGLTLLVAGGFLSIPLAALFGLLH